jgi:hypothetical protein
MEFQACLLLLKFEWISFALADRRIGPLLGKAETAPPRKLGQHFWLWCWHILFRRFQNYSLVTVITSAIISVVVGVNGAVVISIIVLIIIFGKEHGALLSFAGLPFQNGRSAKGGEGKGESSSAFLLGGGFFIDNGLRGNNWT